MVVRRRRLLITLNKTSTKAELYVCAGDPTEMLLKYLPRISSLMRVTVFNSPDGIQM